jgi:uncharacterized protein (DUF2235 family)
MGLAIGNESVSGVLAIGGVKLGGMAIGSTLVYSAAAPPAGYTWTFTTSSDTAGYAGKDGTQSLAGGGGLSDGIFSDTLDSAWRAATATGDQWIEMDLGSDVLVSSVEYAGINGIAIATKNGLSIQTRPNGSSTWTTRATTAGHTVNETSRISYSIGVTCRYVRIFASGIRINASEFVAS